MPISGPTSFVAMTLEFLNHWGEVDGALPSAEPLELEDGVTSVLFQDRREELMAARDLILDKALDRALARAALDIKKEWVLLHLNMFKEKVLATMSTSVYARVLPLVPGIGDGQELFSKPMAQAAKLWGKINGTPPAGVVGPLVLLDGTTAAMFLAAVTALSAPTTGLYEVALEAEQDVALAIERRNDLQDVIYALMKKYRLAVPTRIPAGNALLDTLPVLTPTSSRTPEPVVAAAVWNAATSRADVTFTASDDGDLKEYQLRYTPGPDYDTEVDALVGSILPGEPLVFHTMAGLATAGAVASYKVYVLLKSGGEAGSDSVVVTRPG